MVLLEHDGPASDVNLQQRRLALPQRDKAGVILEGDESPIAPQPGAARFDPRGVKVHLARNVEQPAAFAAPANTARIVTGLTL